MKLDWLDTNFSKLSHGDLFLKSYAVADKLEGYPNLPPFPDHVYNPPRLRALADESRSTVDAAKGRGKLEVQSMNETRGKLELELTILAQYVVMLSLHRNEPNLLHESGFDFKGPRTLGKPKATVVPGQPQKFAISHGAASATALLVLGPFPPKTGLELQYTVGDPLDETSWRVHGIVFKCRTVLQGFEVAKKHFFRGRYHSSAGVGPWSQTASLIMI